MSGKIALQASPMSLFEASGSRKYLNPVERRRFFHAVDKLPPDKRLFCLVTAWSGGRVSEILALTPLAFDIDAGTVAIETLKRRRGGIIRQVALPPEVIAGLARVFHLRRMQRGADARMMRLWPWSRVTAWRCIKRVMCAAGISGGAASPKGLRHTFGVSAFEANVPPHLVQRWLGHASLRTTAIYGDVVGREERKFASRMWRRRR